MNKPIEIRVRTLTPLWTGGVDGTSNRVHATGIIGSLRWWYEVIVRGMGGNVCDPVQDPCLCGPAKPHNELCLGCQIFGATGWKRRFRLTVEDATILGGSNDAIQTSGNRYKRDGQKRPSWYFKGGREGEVDLRIIPTAADFDPTIVLGVLALVEKVGALGAKPQLGYGWIERVSGPELNVTEFVGTVQSMATSQPGRSRELPALDNMFFAEVRTPDIGLKGTLNLKYDVRAAFRSAFGGDRTLRHWVCGYVRGNERRASKVSFSQSVDGVARVWGWIPENTPLSSANRDQVVDCIRSTLAAYGSVNSWQEFNSARDTSGRETDMAAFLSRLLEDNR